MDAYLHLVRASMLTHYVSWIPSFPLFWFLVFIVVSMICFIFDFKLYTGLISFSFNLISVKNRLLNPTGSSNQICTEIRRSWMGMGFINLFLQRLGSFIWNHFQFTILVDLWLVLYIPPVNAVTSSVNA